MRTAIGVVAYVGEAAIAIGGVVLLILAACSGL